MVWVALPRRLEIMRVDGRHYDRASMTECRRHENHHANPARRGPRGSPCCRRGGEFLGCYISPRRLRDRRPGETPAKALRLRTGWRPPRAQIVYTRWVVAWISACDWGTAPPRRHNRI